MLWVIGDSWSDCSFDFTGLAGWPALVADRLGVGVANSAQGGAGWCRWNTYGPPTCFATQVMRSPMPAATVVVTFGSINDTRPDSPAYGRPDLVTAAAAATLALIRRAAPAAPLLVLGPQYPGTPPAGDPVFDCATAVSGAAQTAAAPFVDTLGWLAGRDELLGADAHPTIAGHAYLADRITPLVAALLATMPPPADVGRFTFPALFPA